MSDLITPDPADRQPAEGSTPERAQASRRCDQTGAGMVLCGPGARSRDWREQAQVGRRIRNRGGRQGGPGRSSRSGPARRIRQPVHITVAAYLDEWVEAHASSQAQDLPGTATNRPTRPPTSGACDCKPCGRPYLQAVPRPGRAATTAAIVATTVSHIHASAKAFRTPCRSSRSCRQPRRERNAPEAMPPNPPSGSRPAPRLPCHRRRVTGCSPSTASPPTPAHAAANCSTCAGMPSTSTRPRSPRRLNRRRRRPACRRHHQGGRSRTVSIDGETVAILREHHGSARPQNGSAGADWNGTTAWSSHRWGEPLYPDTVSAL